MTTLKTVEKGQPGASPSAPPAKARHFIVHTLIAYAGGVVTINGTAQILGVSHVYVPRRGRSWWKFWDCERAMVIAYGIPVVERFRGEADGE